MGNWVGPSDGLDFLDKRKISYWFQTFVLFWMLYAFFWVIPRRLNFICRRFGTLCLFHLHRRVGIPIRLRRWNRQSVPKRQHINFRRRGITQNKAHNRKISTYNGNQIPNHPARSRVTMSITLSRLKQQLFVIDRCQHNSLVCKIVQVKNKKWTLPSDKGRIRKKEILCCAGVHLLILDIKYAVGNANLQ